MATFDQRFPGKKSVGLAGITDWHFGSHTCNMKAIDAWINIIKKEGHVALLMGDLCEMATRGSVGAVFEQIMSPQDQITGVVDILEPIKDQIIGGISGNHGARVVKDTGVCPDATISKFLGVPHFGYAAMGRVQVGNAHWVICAHHGAGGGSTIGAKVNALKKLALTWPACDLYMMGHTHTDAAFSDRVVVPLKSGRRRFGEEMMTRHFSGCGSLLDYQGSYAEAKMYPPAAMVQVVHLLGDRVHRPTAGSDSEYVKPFDRRVHWF